MSFVIMPDRRAPETVDALATFSSESEDRQPVPASAPIRRPRDNSSLAVMPITDGGARALMKSVQALADKVDVLTITTVATTQRLTRWIIGLAVLTGLLMLALLAQAYLWLPVASVGR
jgi:hypothetical protein